MRPPLANLDQLVLVVSIADPAPNAFVLDKLIAIAEYQKIEPVIVITKCDLADPKEFADIYRKAGFAVYETRTLEHQGIQAVMEMLKDKTSAFCGNSGAGKSTLLNAIDPRLSLDTGDISQKLGRGRHTTRHVELFELPQGGFVADTPGFSAVDWKNSRPSSRMSWRIASGRCTTMRASADSAAVPTPRKRAALFCRRSRTAKSRKAAIKATSTCMSRQKYQGMGAGPLRFAALGKGTDR